MNIFASGRTTIAVGIAARGRQTVECGDPPAAAAAATQSAQIRQKYHTAGGFATAAAPIHRLNADDAGEGGRGGGRRRRGSRRTLLGRRIGIPEVSLDIATLEFLINCHQNIFNMQLTK